MVTASDAAEWYEKLGTMFEKYPTGFDPAFAARRLCYGGVGL
jgi:hypothetical protein